jgi:hypothetical protein
LARFRQRKRSAAGRRRPLVAGEFSSRLDARRALGVRTIIGDGNVYEQLKILARFVRLAGYDGLLVCVDELVNLYRLASSQARAANYEQLLAMVNDSLQGSAPHLGFLLGGTPEVLLDTRRGLFSYPALASRLAENTFARTGLTDRSGPVLRLANLSPEELYVLLTKLRHVYAGGDPTAYLVPDEALHGYMQYCAARIGDAYFRTPRETVKGFLDLLALLNQHPHVDWRSLLDRIDLHPTNDPEDDPTEPSIGDPAGLPGDDDLASFRL